MREICAECATETICPSCNQDIFKRPLVIKHINEAMPIIIFTCQSCTLELFRSMVYQTTNASVNLCIKCFMNKPDIKEVFKNA